MLTTDKHQANILQTACYQLTRTPLTAANYSLSIESTSSEEFSYDIEIEFELTLLTDKAFSCKDVQSMFLGVRLLAVQSNTSAKKGGLPKS